MDIDTFEAEVLKIERLLYHVSWSLLKNQEDCADAVQEALTRAWKSRETLRNTRAFKGWMVQILTHICQDMLRRGSKVHFVPLEETAVAELAADSSGFTVTELFQPLSPEQRVTAVLFYVDGYRIRDIARILSIPTGTVKTRLSAVRTSLRKAADEMMSHGGVACEEA